jgi:iron complex transport system ATP-binding protein
MSRMELARKVSLVPQEHTDIFPFRVIEVVVMGRTPHLSFGQRPGPKDYALAGELIDSLGYGHLTKRNFNRISGGERRIVLLTRALLQTSGTLLFDEPTNHLDFHNQHLILAKIKKVCQMKGARVIATMHDPNLARLFADQIILLHNGGIIAQGEASQVMTQENLSQVYETPTKCIEMPDGNCMYLPG